MWLKSLETATFNAAENIITGNVSFYGATSGKAYINGIAGERFAVRNSGVITVVEGVGDHGCEYMTGGEVVILGTTGRNFAAGMSGGIAYVYDKDQTFAEQRCNTAMVDLDPLQEKDFKRLKNHIQAHYDHTKSTLAKAYLENWDTVKEHFIKVFPKDYKKALQRISETSTVLKKISA